MTEQEARAEAQAERTAQSALAKYDQWDEYSDAPHPGTGWEHVRALLRSRVVAAPSDTDRLAERLRQIAESQRMDFDSPNVAATLDEATDALSRASQPVQVEPWKSERLEMAERVGDALNGVLVDAGIYDSDAVEEYDNLVNDLVNAVLAALGGGDQ